MSTKFWKILQCNSADVGKLKAKWLQAGGCQEAGMEDFRVQDWRITQLVHSSYPFSVKNWLPVPSSKHTCRFAFCRDRVRKSLNLSAPGTDEGTLHPNHFDPHHFPTFDSFRKLADRLIYERKENKKHLFHSNSKELQLLKTVYQQNSWISAWFPLVGRIMDSNDL